MNNTYGCHLVQAGCLSFISSPRKGYLYYSITMELTERDQWFIDRIWKRIYRDDDWCSCKNIVENGLIVHDKNHATYLATVEWDFAAEWCMLNYRDIK